MLGMAIASLDRFFNDGYRCPRTWIIERVFHTQVQIAARGRITFAYLSRIK